MLSTRLVVTRRRPFFGLPGSVLRGTGRERKEFLFRRGITLVLIMRRRKGNNIALLRRNRREADPLRLSHAVFAAQVAVRFHCQRAAVFVA